MPNDIKTSVVVDLKGNLPKQSKRYAQSLNGFSNSGRRNLLKLNKEVKKTNTVFAGMGKRLAALAIGAKVLSLGRNAIGLNDRLAQLQIDSQTSDSEMEKIKKSLFDVSRDKDIRLPPERIIGGVEEMVSRTGNADFVAENMRNLALTVKATNTASEAVGAMFSTAFKGSITDAKELMTLMNALLQQAKQGAVPFRVTAQKGTKLFPAYAALGRTGEAGFREMNALLQVVIDAVGSPDEGVEAIVSVLGNLAKPGVKKKLKGAGIDVTKNGSIRPIQELIDEIYTAARGDVGLIEPLVGESGIKVFRAFAAKNAKQRLNDLINLKPDGNQILKDSQFKAKTTKSQLDNIGTQIDTKFNEGLTYGLKKVTPFVTEFLNDLQSLNEEAKALMAKRRNQSISKGIFAPFPSTLQRAQQENKVNVELVIESPLPVKVQSMTKSDGLDVMVDTGVGMTGN